MQLAHASPNVTQRFNEIPFLKKLELSARKDIEDSIEAVDHSYTEAEVQS